MERKVDLREELNRWLLTAEQDLVIARDGTAARSPCSRGAARRLTRTRHPPDEQASSSS